MQFHGPALAGDTKEEVPWPLEAKSRTPEARRSTADNQADVFVAFGITGDLAKVMTFALSIGSSGAACSTARCSAWPSTTGRSSTCESARARRSRAPGEPVDDEVFARFAARLSYVRATLATPPPTVAWRTRSVARSARLLPGDPAVPVRHGDQGAVRGRVDEECPGCRREAIRPRPRLRPRARTGHSPVHR